MDRKRLGLVGLVTVGILAAACGSALDGSAPATGNASEPATIDPVENVVATPPPADAEADASVTTAPAPAREAEEENVLLTPFGSPAFLPLDATETPNGRPIFRTEQLPFGWGQNWKTNFAIRTVDLSEIFSGGPPRDGIPPIDNPKFGSIADQVGLYTDNTPIVQVEVNGDVRAYPIAILTWHEIVNDVIGGRPVAVTFCPLCNTAIVFDATVDDMALDFGTTGRLRFSNLLMYDRQTESWWQQATGDAVIGELTGIRLTFLPATIIGWSEARETFPEAQVLSRETGFSRDYGRNPYAGYDDINRSPFLYDGPTTPGQLPPMARVTTVELNSEAVAYPNDVLQELRVANDTVGGTDVVVFWQPGLASALDSSNLAAGRDVGANGVFERTLDGQTLSFVAADETITDEQTGSVWNILGEAISGELAGQSLTPVVKVDHFWFSWAAFRPDTRIYQ